MNTNLSIGIVGFRDYHNYTTFTLLLEKTFKKLDIDPNNINKIVSGGAPGIDTLAEKYSEENNINLKVFYAQWKLYGNSAGPMRNKDIVKHSDIIIAFVSPKSKGTWITINMARKKNKHVEIIKIE